MFFIPGIVISLVTFPGVMMHEIAHRLFCHLTGVPVYEVRYFRPFDNPAGYVIHGDPPTLTSAFLIAAGPLFINTLLCAILSFAGIIPVMLLENHAVSAAPGFLLWVGISMGMHAFPSSHDGREFARLVAARRGGGAVTILAKTFSGVLTVANALRVVWFDLIYAIGVALILPWAFGLL